MCLLLRTTLILVLVWVTLLGVAKVAAQDLCTDPEQAVVTLSFIGDAWNETFRGEVQREMTIALRASDTHLCSVASLNGREPTAALELRAEPALPRVAVTIAVDDHVTQKRVARDIDLSVFTEDSRALALAVASDELLRASWIELALEDAPEPTQEPPRQIRAVVQREVASAAPPRTTAGLRFAVSYFSAGEVLLGGDLYFARQLSALLSLELSIGARRGVTRQAENGSVKSTALGGAVDLFIHPIRGEVLTFGTLLGVWMAQVTYEGAPGARGVGRVEWGVAAYARAAAVLEVLLAPVVLRLTVGVGAPLAQVIAVDDAGDQITGVGGVEVGGSAGLGVRF